MRVNNRRNGVVVHVPFLAGQMFNHSDGLFLGFMSQHRSRDDITDRVNPRDVRFPRVVFHVHFHSPHLIRLNAEFLQPEILRVRLSPGAHQHDVRDHFRFLFRAHFLDRQLNLPVWHFLRFFHRRFHLEINLLFLQSSLESRSDLVIHVPADHFREFHHGHFRA